VFGRRAEALEAAGVRLPAAPGLGIVHRLSNCYSGIAKLVPQAGDQPLGFVDFFGGFRPVTDRSPAPAISRRVRAVRSRTMASVKILL
jgi:hypothetical protein